jgi:hypothetical protein
MCSAKEWPAGCLRLTNVGDAKRIVGHTVVPPEDPDAFIAAVGALAGIQHRAERAHENSVLAGAIRRHMQLYASLASRAIEGDGSIWRHFKWGDNCGKRGREWHSMPRALGG